MLCCGNLQECSSRGSIGHILHVGVVSGGVSLDASHWYSLCMEEAEIHHGIVRVSTWQQHSLRTK